jgi:hypothetical protein
VLTDHFVKCAVSEMSDIFDAPENELALWVQQNAKRFIDIQEFYPEEESCSDKFCVLDTQDRDLLYDIIGLYFTHNLWPRYRTDRATSEEFFKNLDSAAAMYKWKLKGEYNATSTQIELRQGAA